MHQTYLISVASSLLLASSAWAQQGSDEQASACVAVPIFHCTQHLDNGGAIAHLGYDLQCPDGSAPDLEIFIDIGDDNLFSPGRIDRGQPKVFISGEHLDEYEADFTAAEVASGTTFSWSVLDQTATVDFSKTKDGSLDCSNLKQ
jgi:hypothetical protein